MSNIHGIGQSRIINPVQSPKQATRMESTSSTSTRRTDQVELSNVNALLTKLKSNDVRTDLVSHVRAQIESGKYETEEKLDSAVDKLMDDLG